MTRTAAATTLAAVLLLAPFGAGAATPPPVEARHAMVVTAQHLASEAGRAILEAGGNAVDAAVAVGYAEAVVNPCCGNIGGGGFMVLRLSDGRARFIDFRETAPAAATAGMYLDAKGNVIPGASLHGTRAAGVPGTVLGMDTALREYGSMTRAQVMAPAIRLARDGFVLTRGDTDILDLKTAQFRAIPAIARNFLRPDGTPLRPGDRLTQPELATTLQKIADNGPDAFYRGAPAREVAAAARTDGGLLTAADFAGYRVAETAPLSCAYRGYEVLSSPPPSSGGATMCEILGVLSGYDMHALGFHSARSVHLLVEAMRQSFLDRNTYLGDPAFVRNPLQRLLSPQNAAAIRARIRPVQATPSAGLAPSLGPLAAPGEEEEKPQTTQYSVLDAAGNAVSVTYTINGLFGAMVMAGDTGVFLNNEMDDFTSKPGVPNMFGLVQGSANAIAPGKRPLSSMAPTIVLKDGRVFLVTGSPGGSRIITITLETVMNVIDYGMDPQAAVDAPRIHQQWLPDVVYVEPFALSPDTATLLRGTGYTLKQQTPWGAAELIEVAPQAGSGPASSGNDSARSTGLRPGMIYGANDDRRPAGSAAGY